MVTAAVIEDNEVFAEMLRKKIVSETDWGGEVSVDIYCDPLAFLEKIEAGADYKISFVDVCMPELDGIALAERLRQLGSMMLLVFVSSFSEYALEGYRVYAFDYLLKDQLDGKWDSFVKRLRRAIADSRERVYVVGTKNKTERIPVEQILYICKQDKYAVIHTPDREISVRKPLQEAADELKEYRQFVRVKRGIIVNIEKIRKAAAREIVMEDGTCIAVGRTRVGEVREQIHTYLREKV